MIQLDQPILLSTVFVPLLASILLPLIDKRISQKTLAMLSTALLSYPLIVISIFLFVPGLSNGIVDPVYFSAERIGSFSMLLDGLSGPIAFSIALVTTFVSVYSLPYMRHRFEEMEEENVNEPSWGTYYMLFVMFASAMIGTSLSTNLIEFYVFLELTLVPSFLLIIFYGYGSRGRIGLMYLIWTHIGALLFLIGSITFGYFAGTFDILNMQTLTFNQTMWTLLPGSILIFSAIAIMIGLLIKMAVFGVHIWLPYAHAESPTPVSALLSPNLIGIGGYALVRILFIMFPTILSDASVYLMILALVTMIYGGLMSLAQDDFKRMLAYSSISQMGYLLLGIASMNTLGISGAMLQYVTHAIGKAVLFSVAGMIIVRFNGLRSIKKMSGLAVIMPMTAALALIGFMNITGIPPSIGLWSEILIVFGAISRATAMGSIPFILLVIGLMIAIGLSTAYSFITMKKIFFGKQGELSSGRIKDQKLLLIPAITIAAVGILLFFFPSIFIDPLTKAIDSLQGIVLP
jgi:NADH-quinone oxidoreductase subunit M